MPQEVADAGDARIAALDLEERAVDLVHVQDVARGAAPRRRTSSGTSRSGTSSRAGRGAAGGRATEPGLSSRIASATSASSGASTRRASPETAMSKERLSSRELVPSRIARQRHDRHALDVVEDRVRVEDLEVAGDDRDLDVGPAHRPDEVEHLLVTGDRRGEDDAVDLELVDHGRDVVPGPEHGARAARPAPTARRGSRRRRGRTPDARRASGGRAAPRRRCRR